MVPSTMQLCHVKIISYKTIVAPAVTPARIMADMELILHLLSQLPELWRVWNFRCTCCHSCLNYGAIGIPCAGL